MATSSSTPVNEGVFAINKPSGITSAQVIRDAQKAFNKSKLFQPWIDREQARKDAESHNQKQKRRSWKQRQPLQVKMGHGGTLDPMATGVLILGVGNGTKALSRFLECTKSYEAVVLFGVATDSYDAVGKVIARKEYQHVTRDKVQGALGSFRGNIMQRPPIYSALSVQGKRLYEYAREGKEVPVEIQERPVEVKDLDMTAWMDGRTHEFHWPEQEAETAEKVVADKVLHLHTAPVETTISSNGDASTGVKRKREDDAVKKEKEDPSLSPKRQRPAPETSASRKDSSENGADNKSLETTAQSSDEENTCPAPACRLNMTVTSGFYVRSLCHDLGAAVDSLALMSNLVRTRQGDFELGTPNVLEYEDLERGEDVWGPHVESMLREWRDKESVLDESEGEKARTRVRKSSPKRYDKVSKPEFKSKPRRNSSSSESS